MTYGSRGIVCPKCGIKTRNADTIPDEGNNEIYREKTCYLCGHVFYTLEFVIEDTEQLQKTLKELRFNRRKQYRDARKEKTK